MLRALMAFERGEEQVFSVVRVPSVEEEDARRVHRERERLIKERIQHVNRIKGLLATQGIYGYEPMRRHRHERFEALTTAMGTPLPAHLRDEIMRHLQRLELVLGMIRTVERQRDAVVQAEPASNEDGRKVQHLVRLKAIGPQFAWLWLRYQPHSALSHWFHQRVGTGRGRVRRITIVAVARKLLIALWRYVETGLLPDGAELKV